MSKVSNNLSFSQLDRLAKNGHTLANLRENELVWTFGNRVVKSVAVDVVLKDAKNAFTKAINKIITFILKLIYAIGRLITGQSDERNLKKIERLSGRLLEQLNKDFPKAEDEKSYYLALEKLGILERNLANAAMIGFAQYKKTVRKGNGTLFKAKKAVRNEQTERIEAVAKRVTDEVLPALGKKVKELENAVFEQDKKKAENILKALKNKDSIDSTPYITAEAFKAVAVEKYGSAPVERALQNYRLNKKKTLRGDDVAALFIGIVTQLTLSDLDAKYPEADKIEKLNELRNLNVRAVTPRDRMRYKTRLIADQNLLEALKEYQDFNANEGVTETQALRKFSFAEFLAHRLSYSLYQNTVPSFVDGLVFPMYDIDGKLTLMEAQNIVSNKGLHAALVKPAISDGSETEKVHLVFKGTSDWESLKRDINPAESVIKFMFDGPGRKSFTKHQNKISKALLKEIAGKSVEINVMGHSLGASDSQRMVAHLASVLAENSNENVAGVNLFAFNSPNVESDVAREFVTHVSQLENPPFRLRYFDVEDDRIQEFGTKRLGYCGSFEKPDNLNISIFKCDRNVTEKIKHLARHFFARLSFKAKRSLEAHTFYCLKLHSGDEINSTFITDVYVNNAEDLEIKQVKEPDAKPSSQERMDDHLVTNMARTGRMIKRFWLEFLRFITFGLYKHNYKPPKKKLRKASATV